MAKSSAGLLLYRQDPKEQLRLLLVHPGGPLWAGRDEHAWSIPKGEYSDPEDALQAALREYREELGHDPPQGEFIELGEITQASGKRVRGWAAKGDFDTKTLKSNTCQLEWPPKSGRFQQIPEVDRAEWFSPAVARVKLNKAQVPFIDRLILRLENR